MRVELVQYPHSGDWMVAKQCALYTVGIDAKTEPDKAWKQSILAARHSPIRELRFIFKLINIT